MLQDEFHWRYNNLGRLLNVTVEHFDECVIKHLAESGLPNIRLSHLSLMRNLDASSGTRSIDLARRAGITKQAMSEIVAYCEKIGLIHRIPDPSDARARIVLFTEAGLKWLEALKQAIKKAESEMTEIIGKEQTAIIKRALQTYSSAKANKESEQRLAP